MFCLLFAILSASESDRRICSQRPVLEELTSVGFEHQREQGSVPFHTGQGKVLREGEPVAEEALAAEEKGEIVIFKLSQAWHRLVSSELKEGDEIPEANKDQYIVRFIAKNRRLFDVGLIPLEFERKCCFCLMTPVVIQRFEYNFPDDMIEGAICSWYLPEDSIHKAIESVCIDVGNVSEKRFRLEWAATNSDALSSGGILRQNNRTYVQRVLMFAGIIANTKNSSLVADEFKSKKYSLCKTAIENMWSKYCFDPSYDYMVGEVTSYANFSGIHF